MHYFEHWLYSASSADTDKPPLRQAYNLSMAWNREEGGTELIAKRYPFYPLFTAKELLKDA